MPSFPENPNDPNKPVDCPIVGFFDRQRFKQFDPSDSANWYLVENPEGKKKIAMYPTMGRRHIKFLGLNRLIFVKEPRASSKSVNYSYFAVANSIFRIDKFWNQIEITSGQLTTFSGDIFFDYLVTPDVTYAVFVDGQHVYIYDEVSGIFYTVTDPNTPPNPKFIATFGNRIVVSSFNSSEFRLSAINLRGGTMGTFDPALVFTIGGPHGEAIFNQASGVIRQLGVLHNTLYIFVDFTVDIWSNIPSIFTNPETGTVSTFPWKINTTYNWDFGMGANHANTLDIGFGRMTWVAQNNKGLIQVMATNGQTPKRISSRAVDILFQRYTRVGIIGDLSPFVSGNPDGFMYEWENTVFYRLSAGPYTGTGILDDERIANSIEYNFETQTWHRVIERNGERNRIKKHVYFNNAHLVTLQDDSTVYEMSGQFYDNEISNPNREDPQDIDAYLREPFRYERITPIIAEDDYSEFITDWVEIDFVWGESFNIFSESPFADAEFIIAENLGANDEPIYIISDTDINGNPVYMLTERGNLPTADTVIYNKIYRPHLELYYSDNGGISYEPADVRQFSDLGVYQWRMRWYQLGPSRNRSYLLVGVANSPLVILGATMMTRRVSDGAS